jgi:hypothetical protein
MTAVSIQIKCSQNEDYINKICSGSKKKKRLYTICHGIPTESSALKWRIPGKGLTLVQK